MDAKVSQERQNNKNYVEKKQIIKIGMRSSIVALRKEGHTMESICCILDCSRQTIYKWMKRYKEDGIEGLNDLPRSGRRRKLNSNEMTRIENSIMSVPEGKKKSTRQVR